MTQEKPIAWMCPFGHLNRGWNVQTCGCTPEDMSKLVISGKDCKGPVAVQNRNQMEEKVKPGTKIILDRSAIPVGKSRIYDSGHKSNEVSAVIEAAVDWGNGEYRYRIKIGEGRTIFPISRNKFQIAENQSCDK